MNNFILFANSFLSYLLVFIVFGGLIVIASLLGCKARKTKNSKAMDLDSTDKEN